MTVGSSIRNVPERFIAITLSSVKFGDFNGVLLTFTCLVLVFIALGTILAELDLVAFIREPLVLSIHLLDDLVIVLDETAEPFVDSVTVLFSLVSLFPLTGCETFVLPCNSVSRDET